MHLLRRYECVARLRPQVRTVFFFLGSNWSSLSDMMRVYCTVSPIAGGSHEVMVQGKQTPAVLELLGSLGVPEKWIEVTNTGGKKK
jgi:hypothetical protein